MKSDTNETLCGRLADVRCDESFVLEPRECFVDGAEGQIASGASLDFVVDGNAVGVLADAQNCEEDDLFEFTEHCRMGEGRRFLDNV